MYKRRGRGHSGHGMGHNRGRGRGQGGGPPPGLSGREIGLWYRDRSTKKKVENERHQRQGINMTKNHELYLTAIIDEFNDTSAEDETSELENNFLACTSSSLNNFPMDDHNDDPVLNKQLKTELADKAKNNKLYQKMTEFRKKLPAYGMKETIVKLISNNQVVVISGETGCGKTTQVSQFILDDHINNDKGSTCRIVCTQPRRISAISIAERVADERGERIGQSCGYQIRLESKLPRTKGSILYCTTGVLLRWLIDDSDFTRATHIIIDEIHERSIHSDFLLIVVKEILVRRPDLRVILMSATLNAEMFSRYFGNCPMLNIPGFTFSVQQYFLEEIVSTISYKVSPKSNKRTYWRGRDDNTRRQNENFEEYLRSLRQSGGREETIQCLQNMDFERIDYCLIEQLLVHISRNMQDGAVLVFLPGWSDISSLHDMLKKNIFFSSDKFVILPLHSLMPTASQRQIFDRPPPGVRKIVLSTCLAETSITIDDIVYVVDCGKTKEKNYDVAKQLETLLPVWCSKASCTQRKGRAGRVQSGYCFHLLTKFHYNQMSDYQIPEILRTPLEEIALQIKTLKLGMTEVFLSKALEPPSQKAIEHAVTTLKQIDAFDISENLTPLGYHLARLPVHPRIGKIILFGAIMSCLDPVLTIASAMGFKDPYVIPLEFPVFGYSGLNTHKEREADERRKRLSNGNQSDHLTLYKAFKQWESAERHGNGSHFCWDNFLSQSVLQGNIEELKKLKNLAPFHMIRNMKTQFAEHLCQIGFISSINTNDNEVNYNSENQALIKAVLCAGFYPNIIHVYHAPRRPKLSIQQDGRKCKVEIHPKSVNVEETNFSSNWLIYREKIKSSKIFIHDCSPVTPYALLFFGGDITITRDDVGEEIVSIDDWITFNCRESVANLVKRLRSQLNKLLAEKIRNPGLTLSLSRNYSKDRQSMLVKTIIELITSE